jgi:hypothetical protein
MECFLKIVLQVLSEITAPCVKAFREGGKKVRGLPCAFFPPERRPPWRGRGRKNLEALQPFQAFCELAWVGGCEELY